MPHKKKKKMSERQQRDQELLAQKEPHLARQIDEFFQVLVPRWSERLGEERAAEAAQWAEEFIWWKSLSRFQRAEELLDPRVNEARELAHKFHGEETDHFIVTCIDGRNLPVIMFSFVPKLGGAIRSQAGELFSFGDDLDPNAVSFDPDSFEAQAIERLLIDPKRKGHVVFYSFDSHLGCAARAALHDQEGGEQADDGLLADVLRKRRIARAVQQYAETLLASGKAVAYLIPQNFSYDPHDGTLYLGLEMQVDNPLVREQGFTPAIRQKLLTEGKIISTWEFLSDQTIVSQLESLRLPKADFREKFAESLLNNWKAITTLYGQGKGEVYQRIYQRIAHAYQSSGYEIKEGAGRDSHGIYDGRPVISQVAIENKAKIMLKNLLTRWSIAGNDAAEGAWPFAEHVEQAVVITEGGYAPFPMAGRPFPPDAFSVFSKDDLHNLIDHIKVSIGLVRKFRRDGKIEDPLGRFQGVDFVGKPVIVMNHEVVRKMSQESWSVLEEVNFAELFSSIDWSYGSPVYEWGTKEMRDLLMQPHAIGKKTFKEAGDVSTITDAVYELFDRMRGMMKDRDLRRFIINGRVLVVNKLVDGYRRPHAFMPMVV